jgi:hypothetical protein
VFQSKSKADKAADAATTQAKRGREAAAKAGGRAASTVQHQASGLVHSVKEKAGPLAASAAGFASHARERAVTSIDHGIDAAVPKVDAAVAGMEPRVDHARDVIVEDVLPRIHDMLVSIQASKDDLLSRQDGAIAAVTGAPKKRKRKGGMLLAFALLSAAGAGVAWYLNKQQSQPKTDPWATPSRPIGGAPGVDSQVRDSMGAGSSSSSMGTGTSSSLGAAGAGAGATSAGAVAAEAHDSDNGTGGAAASSSGDQDEARMLGTEEIDDLAADAQTEEVEIPGPNTEDTTGLGTTADPASERDTDLGDLGGQPRP